LKPSMIVHAGAGSGKYGTDDRRFKELLKTVEVGHSALKKGSALDAAVAAVSYMEESGVFNCGRGACLTAEGTVELDGAIMTGEHMAGAGVGAETCTYATVSLARWIMENTEHVLIVGDRCKDYAKLAGVKIERLEPCPASAERYQKLVRDKDHAAAMKLVRRFRTGDTVGAVALGSDGIPAGVVSTGGRWMKLPGRVGDSAILGSGVFADNALGAACATGNGEDIIRCTLSLRACEYMRTVDAQTAATRAIRYISRVRGRGTAGIITVDPKGRLGASFNTTGMGRAWFDPVRGRAVGKV
jgi:L-asparaginase / beta-aspartyl-peptidase